MRKKTKTVSAPRLEPKAPMTPAKVEIPAAPKGDRWNDGKPKLSLVLEARHALVGAARVLEDGIDEYGRANWRKGLNHTEIVDSTARHLAALMSGETIDPKSGKPHADHIMCNGIFLSEMHHTRPDLDDRPVIEGKFK